MSDIESNHISDQSKINFAVASSGITLDQLKFGCLQRIANALEQIADQPLRLTEILKERDEYKKVYEGEREYSLGLLRTMDELKWNIKEKDYKARQKKRGKKK